MQVAGLVLQLVLLAKNAQNPGLHFQQHMNQAWSHKSLIPALRMKRKED